MVSKEGIHIWDNKFFTLDFCLLDVNTSTISNSNPIKVILIPFLAIMFKIYKIEFKSNTDKNV